MRRSKKKLALIVSLLSASAAPAHAQSNWTGALSSDWFLPGNWNRGVPTAASLVTINTTTPNPAVIEASGSAMAASVSVGQLGIGTLMIHDSGSLASGSGAVGNLAGNGAVTISGATSAWTNAGAIVVGGQGTGSVLVENGGTLKSEGASIGLTTGSSGNVTVTGVGSTWNNGPAGGLNVGSLGAGTLTITGGAKVLNDTAFIANIGEGPNSEGTVTVSGAGSLWNNSTGVNVGRAGKGTLTIADGAVVSGPVEIASSAGSTGLLNIGSAAGTAPVAPGTLTATSVSFGAGTGTVTFNHTSGSYVFAPAIQGNGSVQTLAGTTVLTGANTYSGATTVAGGTLQAGVANAFSATSAHTVANGATLDTAGFNQRVAALDNGGTVSLLGPAAGSTLTVTGSYAAHSLLRLGTGLGGDGSVSDRLVLDGPGARASGNTTIQITNLGGLGALTTGDGIEVVSGRNGATTTAQTTKSAFSLSNGHVDAGAYEYRLHAADAQGAGENWYLRSTTTAVPPIEQPPEIPPVQPTPPDEPASPVEVPTYRAEVPLLAALPAQLRQADLAMLGNLHRRIGDEVSATQEPGSQTEAQANARRAWARVVYTDLDVQLPGVAQVQTQGHVSGLQAGTDLWASGDWRTGIYVGFLDGSADVSGNARGVTARVGSNDLQSRYLGAYATWMDASGLYADGVLQGGSQRFTVRPDINPAVDGKASSATVSVEVGKPFALNARWSLEPQAQIAYQHNSLDDMTLSGALVRQDPADGWIGRLGVRIKGDLATGAGRLQPYARVNLYWANFGDEVATFIGPAGTTAIVSAGGYSAAELAAGATLALNAATSLYGELGHLWSVGGDATVKFSVQASLGIKVRW